MRRNYRHFLKERLNYFYEWKNNWEEYFLIVNILDRAEKNYYENKKILSILLNVYFFPTKALRMFKRLKAKHIYLRGISQIDVMEKELKNISEGIENAKKD
tara:strand:- start:39 stop:341 length:303 start_codon:yes stop_codon:yes gene_type:complete